MTYQYLFTFRDIASYVAIANYIYLPKLVTVVVVVVAKSHLVIVII